ncbi:hypothetical protein HRbin16_01042 [bacterium HR16]|nr:hypothetical protein HRbin16_01042 [bacterium HR16]
MGIFVLHPAGKVVRADEQVNRHVYLLRPLQNLLQFADGSIVYFAFCRKYRAWSHLNLNNVDAVCGELFDIRPHLPEMPIACEEEGACCLVDEATVRHLWAMSAALPQCDIRGRAATLLAQVLLYLAQFIQLHQRAAQLRVGLTAIRRDNLVVQILFYVAHKVLQHSQAHPCPLRRFARFLHFGNRFLMRGQTLF